MKMVEETKIGSMYIYLNDTPINCSYRVWIGLNPLCTLGNVAAVTIMEDSVVYAPSCCKQQCRNKTDTDGEE